MENNIFIDSLKSKKYFNNQLPPEDLTVPFTDPAFPPTSCSLMPESLIKSTLSTPTPKIVWKRSSEIFDKPQIFDGPLDLTSINQGNLGNCYFIASIISLCRQPKMIYRLFPSKTSSLIGYYEVLLFIEGEWQTVILDDFFPIYELRNKFVYGQSSKKEIWFLLLEKAWAKVNGSYEQSDTGNSCLAFKVLTGFLTKSYEISQNNFFESLKTDFNDGYVVNVSSTSIDENKRRVGLYSKHTYSMVDAFEILARDGKRRQFMQVRNPWGDSEWTGSFSNGSVEVLFNGSKVPLKTKQCGWFFIPFNEFKDFFTRVTVCEVNLDLNFTTFPSQTTLYPQVFHLRVKGTAEYRLESYLKFKTYSRDDLMSGSFILCAKVTRNKIGVNEVTSLIRSNDKTKLNLTTGDYVIVAFSKQTQNHNKASELLFRMYSDGNYRIELIDIDVDWKLTRNLFLNDFTHFYKSSIGKNYDIVEFSKDDYSPIGFGAFYLKNNTNYVLTIDKVENKAFKLIPDKEGPKVTLPPGKFYFAIGIEVSGFKGSVRNCFGKIEKSQLFENNIDYKGNSYFKKIIDNLRLLEVDETCYNQEKVDTTYSDEKKSRE